MEILKSCPFEEPIGKYEIEQSEPMTKKEYVEMLYQRTEYLKSEIADFEQCNGGVEQARLWAIKEQVSRIFGLLNECDKELFPDTVRCEKTEQEYIQTCTTEQLADAIFDCTMANSWNFNKNGIKRWLKKPHREE